MPSLKALRTFAKAGRGTRPFIGFGDPVFDRAAPTAARGEDARRSPTPACAAVSAYFRGALADPDALRALAPLSDTADELRAIAKQLGVPASEIVLGREASETTVKRLSEGGRLADYRVVHFATHGLVAGELKGLAEPALALSAPESPSERDDGLLTASEVAQLKLNADWVVLSACNTAAGDRPGAEALSGLARAFFYAGARALLVSHWPVQSAAAVKLTTRTFAELDRRSLHRPRRGAAPLHAGADGGYIQPGQRSPRHLGAVHGGRGRRRGDEAVGLLTALHLVRLM